MIVWHWQRFLIVVFISRFHDIDEFEPDVPPGLFLGIRTPCRSREEFLAVWKKRLIMFLSTGVRIQNSGVRSQELQNTRSPARFCDGLTSHLAPGS